MTRQKTTEFLQVDVEVRSRKPLPALAALVTNHREVSEMHIGRIGGLHCVHFNLLLRPTTIAKTIAKLATIVARFPPAARREWKTAVRRDFNVGIHAGIGPGCTEYPIDAPSLAAVHALGGRIVLAIYGAGPNPDPAARAMQRASKQHADRVRAPDTRRRATSSRA